MPLAAMLQMEWNIECEQFLEGKKAVECFKYSLQKTCCQRMFKLVLTDI